MTGDKSRGSVFLIVFYRIFEAVIGATGSLDHLYEEGVVEMVFCFAGPFNAAISRNEGVGAFVDMDVTREDKRCSML